MTPQEAENLLARYVAQQCTQDEENLVNAWFNKVVRETDYTEPISMNGNAMSEDWERIVAERQKWIPAHTDKTRPVVRFVSVAAAVAAIAIAIVGLVYYQPFTKGKDVMIAAIQDTTINHRNREFKTVLPDGTIVYLNGASNIRYPKGLKGKERRVVLEGEADFEVSPDKARPFIVSSGEQQVLVLGTHFNIRSYKGEPIKTTLLEGVVKLINTRYKTHGVLLQPGYQATLNANGFETKKVNPDDAISWRTVFAFDQIPLRSALKELGRWYNVGIDSSRIPGKTLDARYKKDKPLQILLNEISQSTDVNLVLKDSVITVE